jgi:hypothetical protein
MCPANDNLTSCKISTVNRLLHAENMCAAKIHCELCTVYNQNVMSEGTVRQWCGMFKDEQTNEQLFMMKSKCSAICNE